MAREAHIGPHERFPARLVRQSGAGSGRPGAGRGRSGMITRMRQAALRTLLVVSERPHPWAFLRDRLDPDLVTVSWARPADAERAGAPWMLAGSGAHAGGLAAFRDRLLCW